MALLFTDIEGSTRRWEMYPGAMREALHRHDEILRSAISAAGGEVFKGTGDGFCAVFATVLAATISAWQAQTLIAAEDFAAVDGIRVRMAVHAGAADARDGDYFGPAVNRVARLLAAAHGGQVLLSKTAADMLEGTLPPSASLLDLGQHALKDLTRPERVFQLEAPGLPLEFPPLHSLRPPPHNLPAQTERLIGRDADRDSIAALLANHRLVTIVGAGGLGKTRMAIELGDWLLPRYPDGVWFVEFAPLQDAARLPEALLSVLSISLIPGTLAAETVIRFLRERKTLLIFDNCEHLVEAAASFAKMILQAARGVSVLATSRELLAVQGEAVFRLPTLEFPEKFSGMTTQQVAEFSAVKVFMQRAGGLVLNDENAPIIAAICHQLDGIALAIELAAARTRMLQPVELLARLNDRFAILTGGTRDVLPRQQTLRAMIAWSYDLLTENEQCVVRRLSVFETSFSLRVAIDVCAFGQVEADSVFGIFATLIDKSMISQIPRISGNESRYRLLETTKQYCLEQLESNEESAAAQIRLISAMIKFYREGEASWPVMDSASWHAIYEPDSENLRAALGAAFSVSGDPTLGVALVSSTSRFWYETASGTEAQRWLERAATCISNATPPDVQAHIHLSIALLGLRGSQASALRAHKLFHETGDDVYAPIAAAIAGRYFANPIDPKKAKPYFDEVAVALPGFGMTKHRAWLLDAMAAAAFCDGDAEQTFRFAAESLEITKHYGDLLGVVFHGIGSSNETFFAVDVIGATALGLELAENYAEPRDRFRLAWVLANLVGYHLKAGDFNAARAAGREVIAMYNSLGCEFAVAMCADEMALLAAHRGDLATAARLSAYAWAYRQANDFPHFKAKQSTLDQLHYLVDLAMPREARDICAAEGAGWTADQAAAAVLTA